MQYDYLIVGSGLFGSVFAEQCHKNNKKALIIDKRNHIAGNCYTKKIENINTHHYGPHIFHTSDSRIWKYVNQFASFNHFINRPKINYKNKIFSFPINLFTLYQLWGVTTPQEAIKKLEYEKLNIKEPKNLEEWILSQVGEEIYYTFIYGYTKKQWNTEPKNLPASIIKRLPIRLNFDDNYFFDNYQGIPTEGYTQMVENMVEGIDVILEEDFFENRDKWEKKAKQIVFTGRIDEFFESCYGSLNYRSLKFDTKVLDMKDFQGNAVINYTEHNVPYTRIIEHKHFEFGKSDKTVISKEYPENFNSKTIPYYPINTEENQSVYKKYKTLSNKQSKIIFGGRLAEYKYYDMHQIIGSSLKKFKTHNF